MDLRRTSNAASRQKNQPDCVMLFGDDSLGMPFGKRSRCSAGATALLSRA